MSRKYLYKLLDIIGFFKEDSIAIFLFTKLLNIINITILK